MVVLWESIFCIFITFSKQHLYFEHSTSYSRLPVVYALRSVLLLVFFVIAQTLI